ncbi:MULTISPECIES: MFS transporter [unclassified Mesorhizobium]|uniref:MFS transporter n=1 Tax=unclassified Mesorhizobium TaxID=325217 RepID=UPI000BAF1E8C|nr:MULTISPECIES: MFS transporter [unclassified Mesorhizobium]AZO12415.1 MFS transporter [Mesorhizobium sp. M3A.F.Ca.ET.080.04.2.1]PBB85915.1 MFS transporter [Mesorhizobium sp. WSM3876]RWE26328.1 MAG: MFS transporter [Mesorhizobium sp.]RWE30935.1 MAG: MFS transporter [Mesorhizobium sp.]RWF26608.1 MAG: MFS transporter [Mesorhizobium sp.]
MVAESDNEAGTQWAALAGVTAALAMFGAAQGLSYLLFTLLMQRQGLSPTLIGLSAAMMPVGLLLSASLVPVAVRLFGARNLGVGCALAGALCFFAIGALQNWVAWFPLRFLIGVIINPLYVLGEVWALSLAPPSRRGRVMGVFNALMGAGYAAGPLVLITVGTAGWPPFIAAISGFVLCALILCAVSAKLTGFEDDGQSFGGVVDFARLAPVLLLAVLVSAAVQQSSYALIPVFGSAYGLPEAKLAALVTARSLGNIFLQIPLGLAAERFGGRAMIIVCAVVTAICAVSLPVLITTPFAWPMLLVMGAVGYGVYTMALIELGSRFGGTTLLAGNAAFALMWGLGGIVGPPGAGALMQAIGPLGLPAVIIGLVTLLVAFAFYRSRLR